MKELNSESFKESLKLRGLIVPGDKVFVACSGGPDSTALFYLLYALRREWKLKLGLLHFNHGLRKLPAQREERFVKKLAKTFNVPFYASGVPVKKLARREKFSTEEAARLARYDFFEKIAKNRGISKIATAHNLDDQAETVLMRVLQGTGLRGLCGIRPALRQGNLRLVRPLLDFKKREILAYLKQNKLAYCLDASNASPVFLRNRIRLTLIPWLAETFHPKAVEAIARIPAILREDSEFLEEMTEQSWRKTFLSRTRKEVKFRRLIFLKTPPSLQFRILERGLKCLDPKSGLSFDAWQVLRRFLGSPRARWSLPKDIDFSLTPSQIRLYKK